MNTFARTALGALALTLSASAFAQVTAEDMIKYRKAGYSFMAWNMGKIKAQVIDGSVPFDQAQVAASANAIAAIANSGMGSLYGPGTDKSVGDQKTRVKPELFQNMPDVGQLAGNFVAAANGLQTAAAEGQQDAIKAAFGKVGETCKACHDKYREK
jgi:cytochrome c556